MDWGGWAGLGVGWGRMGYGIGVDGYATNVIETQEHNGDFKKW